jgi:hypothetical protein
LVKQQQQQQKRALLKEVPIARKRTAKKVNVAKKSNISIKRHL